MPTVNEDLLNRIIRHSVYVDRFATHEAFEIAKFLGGKVYPEITAKIQSHLLKGRSVQHLKDLQAAVDKMTKAAAAKVNDMLTADLIDLSAYEAEWMKDAVTKAVPLDIDMTMPSAETMKTIVTQTPMEGHKLSTWLKSYSVASREKMMKAINVGIALGESIPNIGKRIRDTMTLSKKHAQWIARTATNHVVTDTRHRVMKQNPHLIEKYQIVATLDTRTTLQCIALDGQVFPVDDPNAPRPPIHFNCRSTIIPIIKAWSEMGIEPPKPGTRASMNGAVPQQTTYGDWLKKQSEKTQISVLGKKRWEQWKNGKPLSSFVSNQYKPMNLAQVKKVEKVAAIPPKPPVTPPVQKPTPPVPAQAMTMEQKLAKPEVQAKITEYNTVQEKWLGYKKTAKLKQLQEELAQQGIYITNEGGLTTNKALQAVFNPKLQPGVAAPKPSAATLTFEQKLATSDVKKLIEDYNVMQGSPHGLTINGKKTLDQIKLKLEGHGVYISPTGTLTDKYSMKSLGYPKLSGEVLSKAPTPAPPPLKPISTPAPITPPKPTALTLQEQWEQGLNAAQRDAINYYQTDANGVRNVRYWQAGRIDGMEQSLQRKCNVFTDAVNSAPDYKGVVYRSQNVTEQSLKSITPGKDFQFGYSASTTKSKAIVDEFSKQYAVADASQQMVVFKIDAQYGKDISRIVAEEFRDQGNVYFRSRSQFKVMSKRWVSNYDYPQGGYWEVELKEKYASEILKQVSPSYTVDGMAINPITNAEEFGAFAREHRYRPYKNDIDSWSPERKEMFDTVVNKVASGDLNGSTTFYRATLAGGANTEGFMLASSVDRGYDLANVVSAGKKAGQADKMLKAFFSKAIKENRNVFVKYTTATSKYYNHLGFFKLKNQQVMRVTVAKMMKQLNLSTQVLKGEGLSFAEFSEAHEQWLRSLQDTERSSIVSFSGSGYIDIRDAQLKLMLGNMEEVNASLKRKVAAIERAIDRAPSYPGEVWRRMKFYSEQHPGYQAFARDVMTKRDFGFTTMQSFSRKQSVADSFASGGKIHVHMHMKKAPRRSADIKAISQHAGEDEVLVGCDARYKVTSLEEKLIGENRHIYVELEEVMEELKPIKL